MQLVLSFAAGINFAIQVPLAASERNFSKVHAGLTALVDASGVKVEVNMANKIRDETFTYFFSGCLVQSDTTH